MTPFFPNRERRRKLYGLLLAGIVLLLTAAACLMILVVLDFQGAVRSPEKSGGPGFVRRGGRYVTAHPNMVAQSFPVEKGPGTVRVFVVGSSQAMGSPYVHQRHGAISRVFPNEGGISTWIGQYLRALFPDERFEVINAAKGGMDIAAHARTVREIVDAGRPDLIVLLAGNNERNARVGKARLLPPDADFDAVMEELTTNYRDRLDEIVRAVEAKGARLYLLTVPVNLRDWAPEDDVDFDLDAVNRLIEDGACPQALEILRRGPYRRNAVRLFHIARCYDRMGDLAAAREYYVRAKDADKQFFRCRSAWNDALRRARGEHVRLLDAERVMAGHARNGIPGNDLFLDYCHFAWRGNQKLAAEIVRFYLADHAFPPETLARLEGVRLDEALPRRIALLYSLETVKWVRYRLFARLTATGETNARSVVENLRRAKRELSQIDDAIKLLRDTRRTDRTTAPPKPLPRTRRYGA